MIGWQCHPSDEMSVSIHKVFFVRTDQSATTSCSKVELLIQLVGRNTEVPSEVNSKLGEPFLSRIEQRRYPLQKLVALIFVLNDSFPNVLPDRDGALSFGRRRYLTQ